MPQTDPAESILRGVKIPDAVKASVWQTYQDATDEDDLAQRIKGLALPQATKAALWDAKKQDAAALVPAPTELSTTITPLAAEPPSGNFLNRAAHAVVSEFGNEVDRGTNALIGAGKKLAETGIRGGAILRKIPGVNALDRVFPGIPVDTTPSNTMQRVGGGLEQIAEVVAPSRAITKLGMKVAGTLAPKIAQFVGTKAATMIPRAVVEGTAGGGMAAMQGGDPTVGAVLGGTVPVVGGLASGVASKLKTSATKQVVQALGPTKERFKAMAERLAPQILQRGLRGSRDTLIAKAANTAEAVGQDIDEAIQQYGAREVDTTPVIAALEKAKDAFRTTRRMTSAEAVRQGVSARATVLPDGFVEIPVVFEPRAVKQLDTLQTVITDLGPEARVDQLVAVRRAWDKVVADAGGFAHRAPGGIGTPLKDIAEASTKREATGAIRKLLDAEVPELTALNKEYAFWKSLDDVVTQTMKRTQPHGASLGGQIKEASGQVVGAAMTGGTIGSAFALGKLAKMANAVFSSPRYRLASAQAKDALATAIIDGRTDRVATALMRLTAVEGSKIPAMAGR